MNLEEDENNSVVIDIDHVDVHDNEGSAEGLVMEEEEDEFEGEFGYSVYKLFTGTSTGRKLKRNILKFGFMQLACGLALIVTISEGEKNYYFSQFLKSKYGVYYDQLMWFVSLLSFFMGIFSLVMIKFWASLTTNKDLLNNLLRIYMLIFVVILAFACWCAVSFFIAFQDVDWQNTVDGPQIRPFYACTIVFLLPYIIQILLYTLDISYLSEEMYVGGIIAEPNGPKDSVDLSNVTLCQSCTFLWIMPVVVCMYGFGWLGTGFMIFLRLMGCEPQPGKKRKKKGIFYRITKTVSRMCSNMARCCWHSPTEIRPDEDMSAAAVSRHKLEQRLADIRDKRSVEEAKERERLSEEQRKHDERKAAERRKKEEEDERLRQRDDEETAARARREQEEEEKNEREKMEYSPTLSVLQYKALWTSLGATGSFDCNLKAKPSMHALSEHMRKQGFHVVFATSNEDGSKDLEIGICNIRENGSGPWFLARFLAAGGNFSAVMKCQDPSEVPNFVKKFALAKILKIDTTKT